ncbi:F-box/LRR-repeat protein At2g43260-like [Panicum virgatum]|uniref:F-box domain-containing protein n=1 Tax=Panicum virgatum TaxID=38727 RepID=A0A8T0WCG5_PANVG|nr:F-box/LRR-repeat protein At2g43260-like [Panicum virgatum]KAG2640889.1 hypothetical protein PVAP13_2KG126100 [Panicum virgatum]
MAPPRPRSPPTTRAMLARAAASSDRIPPDVLFDVLLRLPARDLCRLRAVSRSWRALASDPLFVAAHAERHGEPLFLAKFRDDMTSVYVVDLSGGVVKRMGIAAGAGSGPYHRLLRTRLDLGCLATDWNRCSVLDPATGAVHVLPERPAEEHANCVNLSNPYTFFALGQVASTGEHKVLRMFNRLGFHNGGQQIFEVFTINGGTGHARWRGRQGPGLFIDECSSVVVDGVVYFLTSRVYEGARCGIRPDYIVSFDLGREDWRRDLRGPISSNVGYAKVSLYMRRQLALAELKGSLVVADHRLHPLTMDLWFLSDFESGLWVKQYHIWIESLNLRSADEYHLKPLLMLDDGRLVLYLAPTGWMFICDPGTSTFAQLDMKCLDSVAVYTGNLLSSEEGERV